tara:strand:+ start:49598 stop:50812 length:1215 start_codon:yes stop_codon:yes gene_type:complete
MVNCKSVYEPREDSTLLERYVRGYAKGSVLDIGTGSGIQAITVAHSSKVKSVLATDVQKSTIEYCKKYIKNKKIKFIVSDLFENINGKFDTIIFNPPYLPQELKVKDLTLEGGKKGYEVVERFLNEVNDFLKENGIVLIVFSSLTKKDKVDEFIKDNLLESQELAKKHIFFEDLYVYKIIKSEILKKLEKKGIKNVKYLAKGKRGVVYVGDYNARKSKISGTNSVGNKKVAIKTKNPDSKAILRIDNEVKFLKLLNKKKIGPKLLFYDKDYLAYEFVKGSNIEELFSYERLELKLIKKILLETMQQMYDLDKLKINKEEMSHPHKHIIINNKYKPVLIDFERTHFVLKPSNVTQFTDYIMSKFVQEMLKQHNVKIKNKKIINAAKVYKKQQNKKNFNNILELIK